MLVDLAWFDMERLTGADGNLSVAERSVLWRTAMFDILKKCSGHEHWRIETKPSGKPIAVDETGRSALSISASHSGSRLALACASDGIVGIDIEQHWSRDFRLLAQRAFGAEEQALVANEGERAFYRIWTLREAIAKATGAGLVMAIDRKDRTSPGLAEGCWTQAYDGELWRLAHYPLGAEFSLALACRPDESDFFELRWLGPGREGWAI
jgi:4'-phosphopantetheinyl transferase